jgi:hypothetical protein
MNDERNDQDITEDDTEGHAIRSGRIQPAEDGDDTDGHAIRSGR